MPCYDLRPALPSRRINTKTGKQSYIFIERWTAHRYNPDSLTWIPCRQCTSCRLRKSAEWGARCLHEASLYDRNCFITLTYSPKFLPKDGSLKERHFKLFMKRLREKFPGDSCVPVFDKQTGLMKDTYPIRFYHCGEYGDKFSRPHYHAILFNFDFLDKTFWKMSESGHPLYISKSLQRLWRYGFSSIGDVTFDSAAYVARYSLKKRNGKAKAEHYRRIDSVTGDSYQIKPEYSTMSRKPGIAKRWIEQFHNDVYPHDHIVVNGIEMKPPSYYDSHYELIYPDDYVEMKLRRKEKALKRIDNLDDLRSNVVEKVAKAKQSMFIRDF